ncbi:MAG: sulfatase-like hydrolase/transferase [Thermoanaerobaculia bacterium]|nr:sulfatase-like hydrolase/transferase [Thermoanaerobaculia bacterium]
MRYLLRSIASLTYGVSVVAVLAILLVGCVAESAERPNVILIVIDTLRADHLGAYDNQRSVSPNLDAFAEQATLFEAASSQAPHTIPSVLQLMSSRYKQGRALSPDTPTLAELLSDAGYRTGAIVENANFEFEKEACGLPRGFDQFFRNGLIDREHVFEQHWKSPTPADVITAQARRWLSGLNPDQPFFLWLHYFDPHDPYLPPYSADMEELSWEADSSMTGDIRATRLFPKTGVDPGVVKEEDRRHLIRLYDAEIRYLDQSLGELFSFLREQRLFEDALIIVTADHGESFGEHGQWTHGTALYEQQIGIPLIVKYPDQTLGRRMEEPVELLDVTPTVLDVTEVKTEARFDGRSLVNPGRRAAFAFWKDEWYVRTREWKLLHRSGTTQLFHISKDASEQFDVANDHPDVVEKLAGMRRARLRQIEASDDELEAVSREAVEQMKSLGYFQ